MKIRSPFHRFRLAAVCSLAAIAAYSGSTPAQTEEPIAYVGHGAFFDSAGNQIDVTQAFVEKAQDWYRADLSAGLDARGKSELSKFEGGLSDALQAKGQGRLVARHVSLEWLYANSTRHQDDDRTLGKLRALDFALKWKLPEREGQGAVEKREPFELDAAIAKKLEGIRVKAGEGVGVLFATINSGQAYINECKANKVPIPPTIGVMDPAGTAGWKSQGFIPTATQFIVGTPAEVRTYKSTSPAGMCYALPRYTDASKTMVQLDGVICLSQETSKVCIWDNQMSGSSFTFPAGAKIPIGVADLSIDPSGRYQAGGFELLGGAGGVCTDCHAGENPYITHPNANLGGGVLWGSLSGPPQNLPTFSPNRYDPLVASAWPQNNLSQADPTVPGACSACHFKGDAGRFPHLSNQLPGYCTQVLANAITRTMPPGSPGSEAAVANAFKNAYCNAPPNAASADAGDPHITTTNGVNYDFQAAGEFVMLKNSDSGFELQTRQSPIQTSFTPPANPYTGLASCVSLNTAVAVRVGKHRVTYQPTLRATDRQGMQLRIDGRLLRIPESRLDLGGGNAIVKAAAGDGLDIALSDGTAFTVTPRFWASEGYWYLDVDVRRTPAREGIAGPVLAGDWLPRAPDGASFGPRPGPLPDRHVVLNQKFANAWRVTGATSLFDYAPGTSTADFTDTDWPSESGKPCRTRLPGPKPLERMRPELAEAACRGIRDKDKLANCLFDVSVMGDRGAAAGYFPPRKKPDVVRNTAQ